MQSFKRAQLQTELDDEVRHGVWVFMTPISPTLGR